MRCEWIRAFLAFLLLVVPALIVAGLAFFVFARVPQLLDIALLFWALVFG